jgi:outer membrane lipoprotein SlyB
MHTATSTPSARTWAKRRLALLFAPAVFLAGCATNTETGALAGAGLGGLGGAAIGSLAHAPVAGAVIGAAAGGLTGAAIGNDKDRKEAQQQHAQAVAASVQAQQQGMTDIVQMTQQRVSDGIIINHVRTSPVVYNLAANQLEWLHNNGVSDAVIREMQNTLLRAPRRVYVEGAVYGPPPVMVVEEPPPVSVGVGFGYTHYRRW